MTFLHLLAISLALAVDAFAVVLAISIRMGRLVLMVIGMPIVMKHVGFMGL